MIRFTKEILCSAILISAVFSTNAQVDSAKNLPNFLLPEFTKCIIKFKTGNTQTAVINYNVVDQEIVFMQQDNYMVLDNPQLIDTVYVDNRRLIPVKNAFYEVVLTGPVSLFIQHKSNVEQAGTPTGYGVTSKTSNSLYVKQVYGPRGYVNLNIPDGLVITDDTKFWISRDNSMEKFSTKRQFLKIFKNKERELNQFIDSNSIDFNKTDDIIKLCNFCKELLK